MSMISEQIEELRLMAEMFVNGEPYGNLLRRAADTIEMLSEKARADRSQEWIPCSERLPKESGQYFVTEGVEQRQAVIGYYSAEYGHWYAVSDVSAWMPLPKAWKGADDA